MNWVHALDHLKAADPRATLAPLLASLKPGQQILFVRPLTEGLITGRLRGPSWCAAAPPSGERCSPVTRSLREVAVAPHNYRGACCVADSAVLYQKVS